jgi:group I intron endonuclease
MAAPFDKPRFQGLLYRLTFPGGKAYVGITSKTIARRLALHKNQAKNRANAVHMAIKKYGWGSVLVEVLAVAPDWSYLCALEQKAIVAFGTLTPHGYNLTLGGEGTFGIKKTEEQRRLMSEARKGKPTGNRANRGRRHTPEARQKISEAGRGRVFSPESKAKIGASKVGNTYGFGKPCSEEKRRKISEAQKGRSLAPSHLAAIRNAAKNRPKTRKNVKLRVDNTTGAAGVSLRWGKYIARIVADTGKRVTLGRFTTLGDAIAAREAAKVKYGYDPTHGAPS